MQRMKRCGEETSGMTKLGMILAGCCLAIAIALSSSAVAGPEGNKLRGPVSPTSAGEFSVSRFGLMDGRGFTRFGSAAPQAGGTIHGFRFGTPTNGMVRFPGGSAFGHFRSPSRFRLFTGVPFLPASQPVAGPTFFSRGRFNAMSPPFRFRGSATFGAGPVR